ncbi:hypothetical protein GCM10028791_16640 [Echinicola sediminis]
MTIKSKYSDRLEDLKSIHPFSDSFLGAVLDSYYQIKAGSIIEMKEKFINAEVDTLVDSFDIKGHDQYIPEAEGAQHLISLLQSGDEQKHIFQKHGVSFQVLKKKIMSLTRAQSHFLTIEILLFLAKYPNWKESSVKMERLYRNLLTVETVEGSK